MRKDVKRMISRVLRGKKGTGRRISKKQMYRILQKYRFMTSEVDENMDWESYLDLIDIGTHINVNNAVDLAFRLGYMSGKWGF